MRARDARVEDADDDARVAGRDRVGLGDVDLPHVPLQAPERLAVGFPVASAATVSRVSASSSGVPSPWSRRPPRRPRPRRRRRSRVARAGDEHADLPVVGHDGAAGGGDRAAALAVDWPWGARTRYVSDVGGRGSRPPRPRRERRARRRESDDRLVLIELTRTLLGGDHSGCCLPERRQVSKKKSFQASHQVSASTRIVRPSSRSTPGWKRSLSAGGVCLNSTLISHGLPGFRAGPPSGRRAPSRAPSSISSARAAAGSAAPRWRRAALDRDGRQPVAQELAALGAGGLVAGHEQDRAAPGAAERGVDPVSPTSTPLNRRLR